jgi:hypothetical protein
MALRFFRERALRRSPSDSSYLLKASAVVRVEPGVGRLTERQSVEVVLVWGRKSFCTILVRAQGLEGIRDGVPKGAGGD